MLTVNLQKQFTFILKQITENPTISDLPFSCFPCLFTYSKKTRVSIDNLRIRDYYQHYSLGSHFLS